LTIASRLSTLPPRMRSNSILTELKKAQGKHSLSFTDLYSISQLTETDIELIFAVAKVIKKTLNVGKKDLGLLREKTTINFFSEASTRTRVSFELAAKYLGMQTVNVIGGDSSRKKGETWRDTAQTLESLSADFLIVRDNENNLPEKLAKIVKIPVLNAGDGVNEHPTQALLEAFTLREKFGKKPLNYLFIGDALHSRVFNSQTQLYKKLGYKLHLAAPAKLFRPAITGVKSTTNLDAALVGIDAIHVIRLQKERIEAGFVKNLGDYEKDYCLTEKRLEKMNKGGVVMHAGPVMRDSDISSEVLENPRSLVLPMIRNGLVIRMSLLWLLAQKKK